MTPFFRDEIYSNLALSPSYRPIYIKLHDRKPRVAFRCTTMSLRLTRIKIPRGRAETSSYTRPSNRSRVCSCMLVYLNVARSFIVLVICNTQPNKYSKSVVFKKTMAYQENCGRPIGLLHMSYTFNNGKNVSLGSNIYIYLLRFGIILICVYVDTLWTVEY